jgi:hypothetical protein
LKGERERGCEFFLGLFVTLLLFGSFLLFLFIHEGGRGA